MGEQLHKGHRKRVKERFLKEGFESFAEHNILEMLLFYAVPQKDTNELAHLLIQRFGSLHHVVNASYEELVQVKGISENAATYLRMLSQFVHIYYSKDPQTAHPVLDSIEKLGEYFIRKFLSIAEERVYALYLDTSCRVLGCECVGQGGLNSAYFQTRTVVEQAFRYKAVNVVLSHNHPNASAEPSNSDVLTTNHLQKSLKLVGLELLDHIIVSHKQYCSLAQMQYL